MKFSQTFGQALENRPVFYNITLEGIAAIDRAGFGALRSEPSWLEGKLFTMSISLAAKFFTTAAPSEQGLLAAFPRRL